MANINKKNYKVLIETNELTRKFYELIGSQVNEYNKESHLNEFKDIIEEYIKSWDGESLTNIHVKKHIGYPCFVTKMLHHDRDRLGYNIGKYGGLKKGLYNLIVKVFNKTAKTLNGINNKNQLLSWEIVSKGLARGIYLRKKAEKEGKSIENILYSINAKTFIKSK